MKMYALKLLQSANGFKSGRPVNACIYPKSREE